MSDYLPYILFAGILLVALILAAAVFFGRERHGPGTSGASGRPAGGGGVGAGASSRRAARDGASSSFSPPAGRDPGLDRAGEELRTLLIALSETLQRAQNAGGRSQEVLLRAQRSLGAADGTVGLETMKKLLLDEVGRMVDANAEFRRELDQANAAVQTQRQAINTWRQAARIDPVTQLPNSVAAEERLAEAVGRYYRYKEDFALLLLLVDDYDALVRDFGDEGADRLLRGVTTKLRGTLRGTDFLARDAANRFVGILPHTPADQAGRQAERLRAQVESTRMNLDGRIVTVSLSTGHTHPMAGDTPERLMERARLSLMSSVPAENGAP